jgi:hypothetical protein
MSKYQETFKRYEMKYLISEMNYKQLRQILQGRLKADKYGMTTICNIYFDTPDRKLIRTSLEKPVYKEKLRLRSYGTPTERDTVFIEIKKKYNGVVYKRRESMELTEAERYLYDGNPIGKDTQIMKEIDWFLKYYRNLEPAMYISYDRVALYGAEEPELRITFDSNLLFREEELLLECGGWGSPILAEGQRLMEIKIPGAMPLWLSHILDELDIYPVTFSKYGKGYLNSLQTVTATKGEDFKKIKIVEAVDMIRTDIKKTAADNYIGKYANSYDNKCLLITAIKGYFSGLEDSNIVASGTSSVEIDIDAQETYLKSIGKDTTQMSEQEIKTATTADKVFLKSSISILDAIEDIDLNITI